MGLVLLSLSTLCLKRFHANLFIILLKSSHILPGLALACTKALLAYIRSNLWSSLAQDGV